MTSAPDTPGGLKASHDKSAPEALPRVPKGTLSGLLSFVRGGTHSKQRSAWATSADKKGTESRVELHTINDYSYHTYLNDRPVGTGKFLRSTNDRV